MSAKNTIIETPGKRFAVARMRAELTRDQIAAVLGVHVNTVYNKESGTGCFDLNELAALKECGFNDLFILGYEESMYVDSVEATRKAVLKLAAQKQAA